MSKNVGEHVLKSDTLLTYNCVLVCCNKKLVDYFQPYVLEEKLEIYCAHFKVFNCGLY